MEDPASEYEPRWRLAWLFPWFSGSVAAVVGKATGGEQLSHLLVGVAAGVAWQLLFRRDLTSRLTFIAVVATVALALSFAVGEAVVWEGEELSALYAVGILLGLIYTEHYQRRRDARASPDAVGAAGSGQQQ